YHHLQLIGGTQRLIVPSVVLLGVGLNCSNADPPKFSHVNRVLIVDTSADTWARCDAINDRVVGPTCRVSSTCSRVGYRVGSPCSPPSPRGQIGGLLVILEECPCRTRLDLEWARAGRYPWWIVRIVHEHVSALSVISS